MWKVLPSMVFPRSFQLFICVLRIGLQRCDHFLDFIGFLDFSRSSLWTLTTHHLLHRLGRFAITCRGVDCDIDNSCNECTDVDDITMTKYVKHKLSLKRKLLSKRKLKDPLLSATVVDDSTIIADAPSPADQPAFHDPSLVSSGPPELDDSVDAKLTGVKSVLVGQVCFLFEDFAKSLEERFSRINQKFSQFIPGSSYNVDINNRVAIGSDSIHVSQDVTNHFFSSFKSSCAF